MYATAVALNAWLHADDLGAGGLQSWTTGLQLDINPVSFIGGIQIAIIVDRMAYALTGIASSKWLRVTHVAKVFLCSWAAVSPDPSTPWAAEAAPWSDQTARWADQTAPWAGLAAQVSFGGSADMMRADWAQPTYLLRSPTPPSAPQSPPLPSPSPPTQPWTGGAVTPSWYDGQAWAVQARRYSRGPGRPVLA